MTDSLFLRLFFLLLLVLLAEANVRENRAIVNVKCDVSAMHVLMTFTHPFKGIVFTHNNFFNSACSSAASPTSTDLQLNLTLPFASCGTEVLQVSNKSFASNTVIVLQHRMLDTVYDYVQNVSCELSHLPNPLPIPVTNSFEEPKLDSWIALELGASLYSEEIVDIIGIGAELMLTYHVIDGGVHKDMIVKNCIGHDDVIVDEKTKIYQISNPYGCASDSDLVSNFSLIRNSENGSNMVAYAALRNVSLLSRGKFYITCGAELCKDTCKRQCTVNKKQQDPIIFSDMATKGMVNRAFGSKMPSSLSMFERFDRQRRSYNKTETDWIFRDSVEQDQNYELIQKLDEVLSKYLEVSSKNLTSEVATVQSNDSDVSITAHSVVTESPVRSKRAVKIQDSKILSSVMNVILVKSNETGNITTYSATSVNTNVTLFNFSELISGTSTQPSQGLQNTNPNGIFKLKDYTRNRSPDGVKKTAIDTENSSLLSTIRIIITVFALFCLSGTCYNLFIKRRERETLSVSDYITYSEF